MLNQIKIFFNNIYIFVNNIWIFILYIIPQSFFGFKFISCKKYNGMTKTLNDILSERDKYKIRMVELEDAIEKEYGVKVRQEITEVIISFTKLELTILYASLCKLMSTSASTEDIRFYLDLRVKIENILNQMKE